MVKIVQSGARKRVSYAKIAEVMDVPDLLEIQKSSYRDFLQKRDCLPEERRHQSLQTIFEDVFPVVDFSGKIILEFVDYTLRKPEHSEESCLENDLTYAASLRVKVRLVNRKTREVEEQEIFMGNLPLMTERGTFIINGAERVVVSQLQRSPGVSFSLETHISGDKSYLAKIVPYQGAWLEFELDINDVISVRIDRRRKLLVTTFLRALGCSSDDEIFSLFYNLKEIKVKGKVNKETGEISNEFAKDKVLGEIIGKEIIDFSTGEILGEGRQKVDAALLKRMESLNIEKIVLLEKQQDNIILKNTLEKDSIKTTEEARIEIYRRLRPSHPVTSESANTLIETLFFDPKRYNLSEAGRYKLNKKLNMRIPLTQRTLRKKDIVEIIKYLINLKGGEGVPDDIDHLGNRRVRTVGELIENQLRKGLARMKRIAQEKMTILNVEVMTPQAIINIKPVISIINEFFGGSQLSQFMDQTNPLAELTHKRRLSALGPEGLTRERAGYEVRDIHPTHYGRICPIETPEGPNIGLIVSLSTYARVNSFGFLETPYRKVKSGTVTADIEYLSAGEEDKFIVAQANAPLNKEGKFVKKEVRARHQGNFLTVNPSEIDYMDVSPKQLVSVTTALIPFLEHDDANRALMGSNMQRQAVPLLVPRAPLVGTGMEAKVAKDSGSIIVAKRDGKVKEVTAERIVVESSSFLDIYNLLKFKRSNQNTCINQKPIVRKGEKIRVGQVIADGPSTEKGELALGRDVLVAFMPWEGYNFEDAILISEKLVKEDIFTSLHIEEYEAIARDTRFGKEEITRDIPNVREEMLKNLDKEGVIYVGAEVKAGDILVGKVMPKGEMALSAEEKLLRSIFGEKAREVKDTSLRMSHGGRSTVISTKIFSKEKGDLLPSGVNKLVKVFVAQRRKVSVGDKMSGRHGNKGVVAKILPEEDMPFLADGTAIEIALNPLGVPSRMNVGQILETHFGWASHTLGEHVVTPVFGGATEKEIKENLKRAGLPLDGKVTLFDGRTGKPFDQKITVGYIYMMKLSHLAEDKIHARSVGPYSLITQQPLGGKAQFGGQRFGEMEVWAIEGYGAAYTLQEILTVKSDDVSGRMKAYESVVKGENPQSPGVPESFNVLVKELQGLGLNIGLVGSGGKKLDMEILYEESEERKGE